MYITNGLQLYIVKYVKAITSNLKIKIAFRHSEKLPYFFTIHYYLLLEKIPR